MELGTTQVVDGATCYKSRFVNSLERKCLPHFLPQRAINNPPVNCLISVYAASNNNKTRKVECEFEFPCTAFLGEVAKAIVNFSDRSQRRLLNPREQAASCAWLIAGKVYGSKANDRVGLDLLDWSQQLRVALDAHGPPREAALMGNASSAYGWGTQAASSRQQELFYMEDYRLMDLSNLPVGNPDRHAPSLFVSDFEIERAVQFANINTDIEFYSPSSSKRTSLDSLASSGVAFSSSNGTRRNRDLERNGYITKMCKNVKFDKCFMCKERTAEKATLDHPATPQRLCFWCGRCFLLLREVTPKPCDSLQIYDYGETWRAENPQMEW